nr:unnamed protein product [Digitaria exilis]
MVMPRCEVDYVLSYEPVPCDPGTEAWLKALDPDVFALGVDLERRMLAEQEDFKRQIALKGSVSKMVEVANDDDDGDVDEDEEDYVDGGDEEDEEDYIDDGDEDETKMKKIMSWIMSL